MYSTIATGMWSSYCWASCLSWLDDSLVRQRNVRSNQDPKKKGRERERKKERERKDMVVYVQVRPISESLRRRGRDEENGLKTLCLVVQLQAAGRCVSWPELSAVHCTACTVQSAWQCCLALFFGCVMAGRQAYIICNWRCACEEKQKKETESSRSLERNSFARREAVVTLP